MPDYCEDGSILLARSQQNHLLILDVFHNKVSDIHNKRLKCNYAGTPPPTTVINCELSQPVYSLWQLLMLNLKELAVSYKKL
jgi:hypothetical protein